MVKNEQELKEILLKIKEADWEVPIEVEVDTLAKDMLAHIGSIDPVLRDELILEMLLKLIEENQITDVLMREMLADCLSERHLRNGLGKPMDDSVFNRTFTVLIIEAIMEENNRAEKPFLSRQEVLQVHKELIQYSRKEIDLRGYVPNKGWAHSSAHTADALNSIVHSKEIGHKELLEIMELIRDKICVDYYAYIDNEEERLISTFANIYERGIISVQEIKDWLMSFLEVNESDSYPDKEYLRHNRKLFFRGLGYRAKKLNVDEQIVKTVSQILDSYCCR